MAALNNSYAITFGLATILLYPAPTFFEAISTMKPRLFILIMSLVLATLGTAAFSQSADNAVVEHRNLEFATTDRGPLLLDIFTPKGADEPMPVIVWIHGGAWLGGNKENCPAVKFVDKGFVVASISYRLSQVATYPAQIEDCKAAIRWLRAHADQYGIDKEHVGVWGASAGGHLAALLGTTADVSDLETQHGHRDQSSRVQAVCDFFGPTDFLRMQKDSLPGGPIDHDAADAPEAKLIGGPVQENVEKVARASPIKFVTKDDAAFLIVHGNNDPIVPWQQSQYLFDALQNAQVSNVSLEIIDKAGHGFGENSEVDAMVLKFFDRQLKAAVPSTIEARVSILDVPAAIPEHLRELFDRMEEANRRSQDVFRKLSVKQMNFKPANGTHTPRWNAEHMAGRQLLFFSQIYHAIEPTLPVIDWNPRQMPPDYIARHPEWSGAEEARQMQRVDDFCRQYAYLLKDVPLDAKAPGSSWPNLRALLLQMGKHYDEHTANVVKKFALPDWPQE
jgi:acetyl esterase/lipase